MVHKMGTDRRRQGETRRLRQAAKAGGAPRRHSSVWWMLRAFRQPQASGPRYLIKLPPATRFPLYNLLCQLLPAPAAHKDGELPALPASGGFSRPAPLVQPRSRSSRLNHNCSRQVHVQNSLTGHHGAVPATCSLSTQLGSSGKRPHGLNGKARCVGCSTV